jgi:hypothetical protein
MVLGTVAATTGDGTSAYAADPSARADGTLAIRVVRDVTGSGAYQPALALGVSGAPITVTDAAGNTASATTATDGTATVGLSGLAGGKYRVDGAAPSGSSLQPAPAGQGLSPMTSFVDVSDGKNVSLTLGLWNPADYCQENPTLVTGCQRNGIEPGVDDAARSLVSMPFTARGTGPAPETLATQGDTGTVYGIAYRKTDKRVFSGAFAKRAALYGPGGPGAVYVTDTAANTTTLFTTVPDPGTTVHDMEAGADGAFADAVGKQSLGDIDISEDGSTLFVVNLADRKLYLYDAAAATAAAPTSSVVIPDPGCPAAGDWRPGALGVRDGVVYVGGVCSGESTQQQADLRVVVRTFDPAAGTFGAPVLTKPLDFQRGTTLWQGTPTDRWLPWQGTFTQPAPTGGLVVNPEPLLTDIGVEANGDLVLAFRDRFGDQGGRAMPPADGSGGTFDTVSGGDLNRACRQADGSFAWEGTAECANNNVGETSDPSEAAGVVEYYPGEYYSSQADGSPHHETAQGAVAMVYNASRMPATAMDPTALNTGGVGWFDRVNGTMAAEGNPNAYQISDTASEGWGKANGLADLEALCDLAPVQLGDRTWFDGNRDGIQDPDEPAVPGVVVQLLQCDGTGAPLATATTDAQGLYYFGKEQGVVPNTCYTLKFDYSGVDTTTLPGAPPIDQLKWTTQNAGDNPQINSKVDADGIATVTTGDPGAVDHTQDAGITAEPLNKLGDYVWVDTNKNGVQDAGEPAVPGVSVVVQNADGTVVGTPLVTDAEGRYLFDTLPDGTYKVCFDIANLPPDYADYQVTTQNAAGHDGTDSAADPGTGCTATTDLGPAKREDLTLDLGIVPPVNRLGDFVWLDKNRDGVQGTDEPGVPGVTVVLQNGAGEPVGDPMTTDAEGKYLFADLPDGTYKVCFDLSNLPADYAGASWTTQNAASHNGTDSFVDPATGCTPVTELKVGFREDLTLDGGIVTPLNKLGDYVWVDANKNGIQDAGEAPVPGVRVTLQDGAGTPVGDPVTTDAEGKYLFADLPDGTYKVCFDVATLPAEYADYQVTQQNAAGHDGTDSAADPSTGCTMTTDLGPAKREDLTLDLGIAPPVNRVGDFVWADTNKNGVQDAGEPGVPDVTVVLQDGAGTPVGEPVKTGPDGKYLFADLPDGTYKVCFDVATLPAEYADYQLTQQNAAGHDGTDSAADPATACTVTTELKTGHREDLTLDAGIVAPPNVIGDYVWYDRDKNGLQDEGEPGVPNVPVTLVREDGTTVASVTTGPDGKYLFPELADGTYKVCFGLSELDAPYTEYVPTKPGAGGGNGKDSAADPATKCTEPVTVGVGRRSNLNEDLGIIPPVNRLGDYVWDDANRNGLQDAGEKPIEAVPVTLKDESGKVVATTKTGPDGKYLFADLPDGTYQVCFPPTELPGAYRSHTLTKPAAAGHNGMDSAADPASGCTRPVMLGAGHREDFTLDAGYVGAPAAPAPDGPRGLSYTGVGVGGLLTLVVLLLGGGGILLLVSRRRRLEE